MKNRLTMIVAILAVAGLMAAGPAVYAMSEGDNTKGGQCYKNGGGKDFMKDLNLTPEQKEKLKAQREANKDSRKAGREQMKTKMQALHEAIAKPGTTRADVAGLISEVNALKAQAFQQKIDGLFGMKEILTPEQFAKMQEKHKEHMDKKRGSWGKGNQGEGQGQGSGPDQDQE